AVSDAAAAERRIEVESCAAEGAAAAGAGSPAASGAKSRATAAARIYFALILFKIPNIFRNFADMSAKTPGGRLVRRSGGNFTTDKDR
uniref:hypothetical protein n=1 Tax=uncultured Alistipes sp. TaxID=538949 RepID=UPI00263085A2